MNSRICVWVIRISFRICCNIFFCLRRDFLGNFSKVFSTWDSKGAKGCKGFQRCKGLQILLIKKNAAKCVFSRYRSCRYSRERASQNVGWFIRLFSSLLTSNSAAQLRIQRRALFSHLFQPVLCDRGCRRIGGRHVPLNAQPAVQPAQTTTSWKIPYVWQEVYGEGARNKTFLNTKFTPSM